MDPEPATRRTTPASVVVVECAGIKKLKIYHTANINDISQPEVLRRVTKDPQARQTRSGQASERASKGTS